MCDDQKLKIFIHFQLSRYCINCILRLKKTQMYFKLILSVPFNIFIIITYFFVRINSELLQAST